VRMLSCFAPFTAEEAWQRLGHEASVCDFGWPTADPALVIAETTTCVIQVDGRLRDRIEVQTTVTEDVLRDRALASEKVRQALRGADVVKVIVRPNLVNIVSRAR
jgi:leucyl-tRNA synthetase